MPNATPGYVKNMIERSLTEIVDPGLSKKNKTKTWEFFNSKCAYCGKKLNRSKREGHIDHLVSASKHGTNHISNRVLSCANCNEKEKLARGWVKFVSIKNPNKKLAKTRKEKISKWKKQNKRHQKIDTKLLNKVISLSNSIGEFYLRKVKFVRRLRDKNF